MKALSRTCLLIVVVLALQLNVELVCAYGALGNLIAGYVFGKGIDYVWDAASGKPDIKEINRRLMLVEDTLKRIDPRLVAPVQDLRRNVPACTSKEDLTRLVAKADNDLELRLAMLEQSQAITQRQIQDIFERLAKLEERGGISDSDTKQVEDLSRYYHRLYVQGDKDEMMELYSFPIHFYERGLCSRSVVDDEWDHYFSLWTERNAPIESIEVVSQGSNGSKVKLKYRYHWKNNSWQSVRGTAICEILWQKIGSEWKIKGLDERRY